VTSRRFATSWPDSESCQPFSLAWKMALETVEDREGRQVLRDTRQAWQDGYERRESKIAELV
jgi:hypothetical protein